MLGVNSRLIFPEEIKSLVPALDVSKAAHAPIQAALYHPPGGIIRHDAVVWGYARGADRMDIEIHPHTEVQAIDTDNGEISAVHTSRGRIATNIVVNATSGWCSTVARMVDVDLPIVSHPAKHTQHLSLIHISEPTRPY